jgi:uncharacterized membrane protein YkgB
VKRHRTDAFSLVVGMVVVVIGLSVLTDSVDELTSARSWIVALAIALLGLMLLLTSRWSDPEVGSDPERVDEDS